MNIQIQDPPSRKVVMARNTINVLLVFVSAMQYYVRVFPYMFFYVLLGVGLLLDFNGLQPVTTLMEQGMLMRIVQLTAIVNVVWVGAKGVLSLRPFNY